MLNVLVTGASGFVGKHLLHYNNNGRYNLRTVSLKSTNVESCLIENIDVIIHLAGKAHEMNKIDDKVYFDTNYLLTAQLADKAKKAGVKHFIYISSTKVYNDEQGMVLDETSACEPSDAYGKSKLKAEQYLQTVADKNFRVAIIRPPVIYGAGVKGNILKLLKLCDSNKPLPFLRVNNQRSMVFINNLLELMFTIIDQRAEGIFIAGDAQPLSTSKLISLIRTNLNRQQRLFYLPEVFRIIIKNANSALYNRLFGSFVINNHSSNTKLNFSPPYQPEEGFASTVKWYKEEILRK
jgi:nucleoside-diphosphate-sugar epimerase